jgi:hypothetical protein
VEAGQADRADKLGLDHGLEGETRHGNQELEGEVEEGDRRSEGQT